MNRGALVHHWRMRLDEALEATVDSDTCEPDATPAPDRLTLHHAGALCAAGALVGDPTRFDADGRFVEAAFTCTREVALVALGRSAPGRPAMPIVQEAMAEPDTLRPGVAGWLADADRAARATLSNAAVSWVTDARALAARRGEPTWQRPAALGHRPRPPWASLTATVDAVRATHSGTHLFVMRGRRNATDRRVAARIALVWVLVRGEVATSVVLGMRDSLQRHATAVDEPLLEEAITDAVDDLCWARRPSSAPVNPGAHCRYCRLLEQCDEGERHLGSTRGYPFAGLSAECQLEAAPVESAEPPEVSEPSDISEPTM